VRFKRLLLSCRSIPGVELRGELGIARVRPAGGSNRHGVLENYDRHSVRRGVELERLGLPHPALLYGLESCVDCDDPMHSFDLARDDDLLDLKVKRVPDGAASWRIPYSNRYICLSAHRAFEDGHRKHREALNLYTRCNFLTSKRLFTVDCIRIVVRWGCDPALHEARWAAGDRTVQ
jgi:hypothetical protein